MADNGADSNGRKGKEERKRDLGLILAMVDYLASLSGEHNDGKSAKIKRKRKEGRDCSSMEGCGGGGGPIYRGLPWVWLESSSPRSLFPSRTR